MQLSVDTGFELNKDQSEAFESLTRMVLDKDKTSIAVLIGYAGTGKSYTINRVVEHCLSVMPILRFAMTAPTHKAVRVLKATSENPDDFLFSTIHSLLGLQQDVTSKGKVIYTRDPLSIPDKIRNVDILIVDEASMLNAELFDHLINFQKRLSFKLIFVGDAKQINPIGEEKSNPFISTVQQKHDMKVITLSKIVRQAGENPIIDYATAIRSNQKYDLNSADKGDTGISCIGKTMFALAPILEKYFLSEEFKANPDYVKIIAWRNQTVDEFNRVVRQMVYKKKVLPKILEGEYLVADKPIVKWDVKANRWASIINTNEEMTVTRIHGVIDYPITYKLYELVKKVFSTREHAISYIENETSISQKGRDFWSTKLALHDFANGPFSMRYRIWNRYETCVKVYRCTVRLAQGCSNFLDHTIDILHESSEGEFEDVLKQIKQCALSVTDDLIRRQVWVGYYNIQNHFAYTKYNYALTSHKSQGSTYEYAIIHDWDINLNTNEEEKNRIKYVAVTRARNKLFIVKE